MQIRKIDKKIPIIMFTAHPDIKSIKGAKKLGATSYIPKLGIYSEGLKLTLNMIAKKLDKKE